MSERLGGTALPSILPIFPLTGVLLLPRGGCRSTSSSRAIWR
jgi:Lon protease-like protein